MASSTQIKIKRRFELHGLPRSKFSLIYLTRLFICFFLILTNGCAQQKTIEDRTSKGVSPEIGAPTAEELLSDGVQSFKRGKYGQAISKLEEAEQLFEKEKNRQKQCKALMQIAQAYQSLGQYEKSLAISNTAVDLAKSSADLYLMVESLSLLGNIYLGFGQTKEAQQYLDESLRMSQELGRPEITASILNNLGNLYTTRREYDRAYNAYMECISLVKNDFANELKATALTNVATAAMRNGWYEKSKLLLDEAASRTRSMFDSRNKAYGLINIGLTYQELISYLPDSKDWLLRRSSEMFNEAADVAEKIDDNLALSYASGYLGNLFENELQFKEALYLTRLAIFKAQEVNAPEALFRWQWQAGRLFKSMGNLDEALSLYRNSISTLQSIRQEKSGCYGWSRPTISESTEMISLELVDLILKRASSVRDDPAINEPYLEEAREVLELLKVYELRNYYKDDCVDAARTGITKLDEVSKKAVIIYPIVLKERTEVLFTLPEGLKKFSINVSRETLTREVREFRKLLEKRTTREFLPYAQKLYDWLIRPMESELNDRDIDTMVFIPDGPLRTIPMATLWDGNQFLIEKYAVAITPGLDLTDPKPISDESRKVLIFALTQSAQGYPALPYISSELQIIENLYSTKLLMNQDFSVTNIEESLKDEQYTILHVASHAQFDNEVDKTFLLTFDERLTIDNLNQHIGLLQFRDHPLELLTLSACETAAGDDRAALGLAGVAVKAGARSALATLWHINDLASSILVGEFYHQLRDSTLTRAKALQRAQLKLFSDRRFQHPGYWSPFLLISNWL
jgi:CHAT domain-containing protein/Flp pilus assembly protein TadD